MNLGCCTLGWHNIYSLQFILSDFVWLAQSLRKKDFWILNSQSKDMCNSNNNILYIVPQVIWGGWGCKVDLTPNHCKVERSFPIDPRLSRTLACKILELEVGKYRGWYSFETYYEEKYDTWIETLQFQNQRVIDLWISQA